MPTSSYFNILCLLAAVGCASETANPSPGTRGGTAGAHASTSGTAGGSNAANPTTPLAPSAGGAAAAIAKVGSTNGGAPATCAKGMQTTDPVVPTVWLIVDGSGSMDDMFEAGRSRWDALRATLVNPGGVVDSLQSSVRFGMVIYSGGGSDPADCVQLITVNPALNNLAMITSQYPTRPLGSGTPTDKALDHVVKNLPVTNTAMLDTRTGPIYVVLATDGQPNDRCAAGGQRGGGSNTSAAVEQRVIDITANGAMTGMQMFVISLAGSDTSLQNHLNQVAAATASKTPPYAPSTQNDLIAAFRKIVGGATCQVALDGAVKAGAECSGMVRLNTTALACNAADGWKLSDPRTVQLTGTACSNFLASQSVIFADFPCEAFTPD